MQKHTHAVSAVALIAKESNSEALAFAETIQNWLVKQGIFVWTASHGRNGFCCDGMPRVDVAITLGGDGTFVSVARSFVHSGIPLVGINFGRVGFLAKMAPESWEKSLAHLLENGVSVEERMVMQYKHWREGVLLREGHAVNDVVITRGKYARLVNLEVSAADLPLATVRSDGLILATPTGSSGYAHSAGGPLLFPTLNAYVVAAICPYLGNFPPMVTEAETVFTVTAKEGGADLFLTVDGQETFSMEPFDTVEAYGLPAAFLLAEAGTASYFEKLKQVGFIQEAPGRSAGSQSLGTEKL